MIPSRAARRYARAIFNLAQEQELLDVVQQDLSGLDELARTSVEFETFLTHPLIPAADRKAALTALLEGKVNQATLQLLLLLVDKDRLAQLDEISAAFARLYRQARDILQVEITSTAPLSAEQQQSIEQKLQKKYNKQIETCARVDADLIGGFRIRIGDQILDSSIAAHLETLKQRLINA